MIVDCTLRGPCAEATFAISLRFIRVCDPVLSISKSLWLMVLLATFLESAAGATIAARFLLLLLPHTRSEPKKYKEAKRGNLRN